MWEQFCAVRPPGGEEEPEKIAEPAAKPSVGSVVWEDDGTLRWELRPARQAVVPGFVSVQVDGYAKGVQPQDRQLVVVEPTASYDVELGTELRVARGTQWWYPGTPLQCKVVNRSKALLTLKRGGVVARIYAVNTSDRERMRMLRDPTVSAEPGPTEPGVESSSAGKPTVAPPEEGRRAGAGEVDLSQANNRPHGRPGKRRPLAVAGEVSARIPSESEDRPGVQPC